MTSESFLLLLFITSKWTSFSLCVVFNFSKLRLNSAWLARSVDSSASSVTRSILVLLWLARSASNSASVLIRSCLTCWCSDFSVSKSLCSVSMVFNASDCEVFSVVRLASSFSKSWRNITCARFSDSSSACSLISSVLSIDSVSDLLALSSVSCILSLFRSIFVWLWLVVSDCSAASFLSISSLISWCSFLSFWRSFCRFIRFFLAVLWQSFSVARFFLTLSRSSLAWIRPSFSAAILFLRFSSSCLASLWHVVSDSSSDCTLTTLFLFSSSCTVSWWSLSLSALSSTCVSFRSLTCCCKVTTSSRARLTCILSADNSLSSFSLSARRSLTITFSCAASFCRAVRSLLTADSRLSLSESLDCSWVISSRVWRCADLSFSVSLCACCNSSCRCNCSLVLLLICSLVLLSSLLWLADDRPLLHCDWLFVLHCDWLFDPVLSRDWLSANSSRQAESEDVRSLICSLDRSLWESF